MRLEWMMGVVVVVGREGEQDCLERWRSSFSRAKERNLMERSKTRMDDEYVCM